MEGKEPIKVSLQTALLIFAIIVILIMAVIIGILYNKNIKLENTAKTENETVINNSNTDNIVSSKIDEENNAINNDTINNNTSSKAGVKLVQFDTEFYKLEDIALEYRKFGNIKNYKDFEYDLDGDGIKDKITIKHSTKEQKINPTYTQIDEIYKVQLNETVFMDNENGDDITTIDSLYIVDLNKNDNKTEVVFEGYGPSDDPHYIIFSKDSSTMKSIASADGINLMTDRQGTIVVDNLDGGITPNVYDRYYIMQNDTIEEKKSDINMVKDSTFKSEGLCFIKGIDNAEDLSNVQGTYESGKFEFNILKFQEQSGSLYVKLKDGREGLLVRVRGYLAG